MNHAILVPCCSEMVCIVWLWLVFIVLNRNIDSKHLLFPVVQSISLLWSVCAIFCATLTNELFHDFLHSWPRHALFSLSAFKHGVNPNSENNSPDHTVFPLTEGSCAAKVFSLAWNCTWVQTFFFFFFILISKLSECPCILLRSVLLTVSPALLIFRGVRTTSKSTN